MMRRGASRGVPIKAAKKPHARMPLKRILHLVHRIAIFIGALSYIKLSFDSARAAVGLLRGRDDPLLPTAERRFDLMSQYVGTATLRESLLVTQALGGSTRPVNGTVYLHSATETSFTMCAGIPTIQQAIADDAFLRSVYTGIAQGTSYHVPTLSRATRELVAPLVDCSTTDITDGDASSNRFYFLTRQRDDTNNVSIVVVTLSNQPYEIVAQGEEGFAGVATVQIIHDMRAKEIATHFVASVGYPLVEMKFRAYEYINTTETGFWTLRSVPTDDDSDIVRYMLTANRDGFYIKAESEQSNLNVQVWERDTDPLQCVGRWKWITKPVISDSWAWVHIFQFFIGMNLLSSLVILCLATYWNVRAGKWWVGDAFVAISTAQLVNGALVLFSWFMNEYWVLHEFAFFIAYEVSDVTTIFVDTTPLQAGLLTIYLSACGIIGQIFREKVDPFFAMICYAIGFECRIAILKAIPALHASISEYARYSYWRGVSEAVEGQQEISPMRSWTSHPIGTRNYAFVFQCLFPIYSSLVLIIVYIAIRKVYRRKYPVVHVTHRSNSPSRANSSGSLLTQKRVLTLFEVATGAELENRYGVVSDYETCLFIKGMKFASADGIYSTGFVIANKKYLLQTDDYWSIVLMKLLRRRYTNIFVYEVSGSTVQQMARLVYPHTLTFQDLSTINVSVLS